MQGAILAGGEATRFDRRPKGLERIGGVRILDRLIHAFTEALGTPPLLIANDPGAAGWAPGLRVAADVRPGCGAAGGILTAVTLAPAPVVVVAWDMPFVSAALIRALAEGLSGVDACLPASATGKHGLEPLCAAYGPATTAAVAAALGRGDLRAVGFHDALKVGILTLERVRQLGDPALLFYNVNTADDLQEADQLCQRHESSP
jgi:molybdopterin-guanine dinucleotide biosynthesis protein A